jgi:hypothetical protein
MIRRTHIVYGLLIAAIILVRPAVAQRIDTVTIGEAAERHLPPDERPTPWVHDPDALASDSGDQIETIETTTQAPETVKLTGVVPPIYFASGVADIPDSTVEELRQILEGMRDRVNVRLHLVGHADTQPLSPALAAIFGDNAGLSRERAGQVAELFQRSLGRGARTQSTRRGRDLVRRVFRPAVGGASRRRDRYPANQDLSRRDGL